MKALLSVIFTSLVTFSYAQSTEKTDSVLTFLRNNNIKLNTVIPPKGFTVYYNCDSLLFMKGIFGDTIKIWTPLTVLAEDIKSATKSISNEQFGHTQLVTGIQKNGTMLIARYHQTTFLYRRDSLFEIKDSVKRPPSGIIDLFTSFIKSEISESTMQKRIDSINLIPRANPIYVPKLIFAKGMFKKGMTGVALSKTMNFESDSVVLEKKWIQKGVQCYLLRIYNKDDKGEWDSYSYTFDDKMNFIWWEGCSSK